MLHVFTAVGGHFEVCLYMTLQTGWTISIFRLEFSFGCFPTECAVLRLSETDSFTLNSQRQQNSLKR